MAEAEAATFEVTERKATTAETNPLLVLRQAIRRVTPNIGVKTRRNKKGSTRKVPITFLTCSYGTKVERIEKVSHSQPLMKDSSKS